MGATAGLHSLSSDTCEAFEELAECYWPTGEEPEQFSCDLDKAWHLLHFLLTGTAKASDHALGIIYERGPQMEAVSEYCCAVSPQEMQAFLAAFNEETPDTLKARLDWKQMVSEETYQAHFGDDPEEAFIYATSFLPDLRDFAKRCVDGGCGALVVIA